MSKHDHRRTVHSLFGILTVIALVALAGCGSDDDGGTEPPAPDTTPPAAVSEFIAVEGDGEVTLTWSNPTGGDFTGTVVRRFTDTPPSGPDSGSPIYAGAGETCVDQDVTNGVAYTYAAYTHDAADNYADAVTAVATPHPPIVVTFPDPNLEQLIRDETGISSGDITDFDLRGITELTASDLGIADLQGLEYCLDLVSLELHDNPIDDDSHLDVLASLPVLTELTLNGTSLTDLAPLADLSSLTHLVLADAPIDDLAPLASLTSLEQLQLNDLAITDLTPLTGIASLTYLALYQCAGITSFATVGTMTQLTTLRAHDVATAELGPLSVLDGLEVLEIDGCRAHDLDDLLGLTQLQSLSVYRMPLLYEAVTVQIPALQQAGVYVGWSATVPVSTVGVWAAVSVTVGGSTTDMGDFFDWEPGTVTTELTVCVNGEYGSVELDGAGNVLFEDAGTAFVYDDHLEVTVMTENGVDVQDYVAFDGTWQVVDDTMILTAEDEGSVIVITWER